MVVEKVCAPKLLAAPTTCISTDLKLICKLKMNTMVVYECLISFFMHRLKSSYKALFGVALHAVRMTP